MMLTFDKMMATASQSDYDAPCAGHVGTHATRSMLPRKCRMSSSLLATVRFVPTKKRTQDAYS